MLTVCGEYNWLQKERGAKATEKMSVYGYIRVSSREQNVDRQLMAMHRVHIPKRNIFMDKQSGKDFERPMYRKMLKRLKENDVVYVKSIDRLGRNYKDVVEQWQYLTRDRQVDIVVLEMPLLDTRRGKDLLGTFLSDVVLQVLSFVAENERSNIRSRQREGIEAAKARGVRFGRPMLPMPDDFREIYEKYKAGEITCCMAAEKCGFSRSTFFARARDMKKKDTRVPAKYKE